MATEVTQEQRIERRREQSARRLSPREQIVVGLAAAAFVLAAAGLWIVDPPHHVRVVAAIAALVAMTCATRVRFETPFGYTTATQLAFVPLVFALPPAFVAPAACLAVVLADLPDVVTRRVRFGRLLYALPNCWFALGPAWVFGLAHADRDAPGLIVVVAALAAQFLIDFVASATIQLLNGEAGIREQLRDTWVYLVDAALSCVGYLIALQMRHSPYAVLAILPLLGLFAMFARERSGRLDKLLELNDTYKGTALLLGDVVEADDAYTGMHSQGVVALALAVGDALGLEAERRRDLEFAALLHDVGKIAIPKEIINKPGSLDADEWALVKTHAAEGQRMLARVGGFMADVGMIVRSHHERWDGGGYPDGLIAEGSPLEARIITACDSWSAMRTDRPYRRAMSHESAVEEVRRNAGTQFDPRVALALLRVVGVHDPGSVTRVPVAATDA